MKIEGERKGHTNIKISNRKEKRRDPTRCGVEEKRENAAKESWGK